MDLFRRLFSSGSNDKELREQLKFILGFAPGYLPFYETAITHRSVNETTAHNNERLEFLGDAFIGSIIGEYLFQKYPYKDEGFLTEMRSKIVSRHSLNEVAVEIGLSKIIRYNLHEKVLRQSNIFGNAFEALVGAVYLDKGFAVTRKFLLQNILVNYIDLDLLENTEYNFKNKLQCWAQNRDKCLEIAFTGESTENGRHIFEMCVKIDDQIIATGTGYSKKEAGQHAAEKALQVLEGE